MAFLKLVWTFQQIILPLIHRWGCVTAMARLPKVSSPLGIIFCSFVTVHIVLFAGCEQAVWVLILVTFDVEENWLHGSALYCHLTDCHIEVAVITGGFIGVQNCWCKEGCHVGDHTQVITETL